MNIYPSGIYPQFHVLYHNLQHPKDKHKYQIIQRTYITQFHIVISEEQLIIVDLHRIDRQQKTNHIEHEVQSKDLVHMGTSDLVFF
jgi:hypothetical protein